MKEILIGIVITIIAIFVLAIVLTSLLVAGAYDRQVEQWSQEQKEKSQGSDQR